MAAVATVPDGKSCDDVLWWCDCAQCVVSVKENSCHDTSFETALRSQPDYHHAAHAMIYAKDDRILFEQYKMTANIMVGQNFC